MSLCDMCGSSTNQLFVVAIEGSDLKVCKKCSSFGRIKNVINIPIKKRKILKEEGENVFHKPKIEQVQVIVSDFGNIVKNARERKGLKQKDVARLIKEKESIVHKVESGSFKPSIKLAEKLERFFKIKLIEKHEEIHTHEPKEISGESLTIGDMIKIRKHL